MEAGKTYTCLVENYGLKETKSGLMQVWVKLYDKTNKEDTIVWTGTLKPGKAQEIAFRALKTMGFTGDIEALNSGTEAGALDTTKEVQVETELNAWTDAEGNSHESVRVRWINSTPKRAQLAPERVHIKKASFMNEWKTFEIAERVKVKPSARTTTKQTEARVEASDIPF